VVVSLLEVVEVLRREPDRLRTWRAPESDHVGAAPPSQRGQRDLEHCGHLGLTEILFAVPAWHWLVDLFFHLHDSSTSPHLKKSKGKTHHKQKHTEE
jgi:hypothetical protein